MSEERQELPFKNLGERLKGIRQKLHESVAEVSGAVEIDEQKLQRIEQGQERPSEDILLLLITHFGMHDDEAAGLWQLAGYDQPGDDQSSTAHDNQNTRTMVMIMAVDPRIIYSDGTQVVANKSGVTVNFSQGAGTPSCLVTARIGMSREQAQELITELQDSLTDPQPRQLPASFEPKQESKPKQKQPKRQSRSDDSSKK